MSPCRPLSALKRLTPEKGELFSIQELSGFALQLLAIRAVRVAWEKLADALFAWLAELSRLVPFR
jgi:hypothetical protein